MQMRLKTELQAWLFAILGQLTGSKYFRLRSRSLKPEQGRARMYRDLINPRLRYKILERDRFTCTRSGRTPPYVRLEVDHIIPLAHGGTNKEENLAMLCYRCNRGKGAL